MAKRWRLMGHDTGHIEALQASASIPPLVAQLLLRRGVADPESARRFLESRLAQLREPELLPGIPRAVEIILDHVARRSSIVIYGDYDADGMTASAILYGGLRRLGANVTTFVPNRLEEGYGLHAESFDQLRQRGAELVISVDCGIGSIEPIAHARSLGIDVVVTDHHTLAATLPDANAIVHPRLPGSHYPFDGLCGAGVAFKLIWALGKGHAGADRVAPVMREFLLQAVGLAALGTVADVVPLIDENRIIVRHGLAMLPQTAPLGLAAMLRRTQMDQKSQLSSEDLAFGIAPRLNAAGRLGQAALGVELLTTEYAERAETLAQYLDELNKSRGTLERRIYQAAKKQAEDEFDPQDDPALVLAAEDWHVGVIGIVAGRLVERYHRPVIMIAIDGSGSRPAVGSCRSPAGFHIYRALAECAEHLVGFGGHAAAAGLRIEPNRIGAFRDAFCEAAGQSIADEDRVAEIEIDAEAALPQLTLPIVQQIEQLAPFGMGNPRPILCATAVRLAEPPRRMGNGNRHLSLRVEHHGTRLRAVAFGQADWADQLNDLSRPIDVAFRPVINEFRGRRSVELHLVDWRPTTEEGEDARLPT